MGYYSGYILVVFGKRSLQRVKFKSWPMLDRGILAYHWLLLVGAPIALFCYGFDRFRSSNNGILAPLHRGDDCLIAQPALRGVERRPHPVAIAGGGLRQTRGKPIPTSCWKRARCRTSNISPTWSSVSRSCKRKCCPSINFPPALSETNVIDFIFQLGREYPVYYLHPSFGYFFEQFYLRPASPRLRAEGVSPAALICPRRPPPPRSRRTRIIGILPNKPRSKPCPNWPATIGDAARVSVDYSVALDFWGVELQRANRLPEAHSAFAESFRINTNNLMAKYNMEYNEQLQRGDHRPMGESDTMARALNYYKTVPNIIKYNGPPDEPEVDMAFGQMLAQGSNLRQAAGLFERRLQLLPNDVPAKMAVAKTLVDTGQPERALDLTRQIRAQTNALPDELFWVEAVAYLFRTNFPEAERSLLQGQQQAPTNPLRMANVMEFYRRTGLASLRRGRHDEGIGAAAKGARLGHEVCATAGSGPGGGEPLQLTRCPADQRGHPSQPRNVGCRGGHADADRGPGPRQRQRLAESLDCPDQRQALSRRQGGRRGLAQGPAETAVRFLWPARGHRPGRKRRRDAKEIHAALFESRPLRLAAIRWDEKGIG